MACPRGSNVGSAAVCVASAVALLLVLPAILGYQLPATAAAASSPQFDDLPWNNLEDDAPQNRPLDALLYLPRQTLSAERAKRTGLVGGMRGPLGGLSMGGGGGDLQLSINAPLDALRQRVMLELIRRRMRESEGRQIQANRERLDTVGKRSVDPAVYELRRTTRDTSRKSSEGGNDPSDHQHSRLSPVL